MCYGSPDWSDSGWASYYIIIRYFGWLPPRLRARMHMPAPAEGDAWSREFQFSLVLPLPDGTITFVLPLPDGTFTCVLPVPDGTFTFVLPLPDGWVLFVAPVSRQIVICQTAL